MKRKELEQEKAFKNLDKAIGGNEKPKTREILSYLIALRVDDLVKQTGDPELGAVL